MRGDAIQVSRERTSGTGLRGKRLVYCSDELGLTPDVMTPNVFWGGAWFDE